MGIRRIQLEAVTLSRNPKADATPILDQVDCEFEKGTITLILGPTGAGKTSTLMTIAGILRPSAGIVWSDEHPVSKWQVSHRDKWRRQVGIGFQQGLLLPDLTAEENIITPLIPRGLSLSEMQRSVDAIVKELDLSRIAQKKTEELSGGECQRVLIARALVHRPSLILLDEPTAHQDPDGLSIILNALKTRRKDAITIVATHDDRVLNSAFADHRYFLKGGSLQCTPLKTDTP